MAGDITRRSATRTKPRETPRTLRGNQREHCRPPARKVWCPATHSDAQTIQSTDPEDTAGIRWRSLRKLRCMTLRRTAGYWGQSSASARAQPSKLSAFLCTVTNDAGGTGHSFIVSRRTLCGKYRAQVRGAAGYVDCPLPGLIAFLVARPTTPHHPVDYHVMWWSQPVRDRPRGSFRHPVSSCCSPFSAPVFVNLH